MKVLELFSGNASFSKRAKKRGHETFTIDNNPDHDPDLCKDMMDVDPEDIPFKPVIIWASVPCQTFSVASIYDHWTGGQGQYVPKTDACKRAIDLLNKTLSLINKLNPKYFIIENP